MVHIQAFDFSICRYSLNDIGDSFQRIIRQSVIVHRGNKGNLRIRCFLDSHINALVDISSKRACFHRVGCVAHLHICTLCVPVIDRAKDCDNVCIGRNLCHTLTICRAAVIGFVVASATLTHDCHGYSGLFLDISVIFFVSVDTFICQGITKGHPFLARPHTCFIRSDSFQHRQEEGYRTALHAEDVTALDGGSAGSVVNRDCLSVSVNAQCCSAITNGAAFVVPPWDKLQPAEQFSQFINSGCRNRSSFLQCGHINTVQIVDCASARSGVHEPHGSRTC